jgi:7-carboxy-7-deazaguanine synthase
MLVLEVFDSLQGEGAWAGVPMTFVRLAGCNGPDLGLGCVRWCDTPNSWDLAGGVEMSVAEVAEQVRLARVCVTGGEPLLQAEAVARLTGLMHLRDISVHLETNGTLVLAEGEAPDWVTASPKPPHYTVHPGLGPEVDELKFVVDASFAAERAEMIAAAHPRATVCLQPEASAGEAAVNWAVAAVLGHPTWRLSLQLHKILGLR